MVPCWLKRNRIIMPGHVCPVPGCGRHHTKEGYFNASEVEMVMGPSGGVPKKGVASSTSKNNAPLSFPASPKERPLNRQTAARAAILKAIESKRRS